MSAKPMPPKILSEALGDGMYRQSAGIGGNNGSWPAHRLYLAQQSPLQIHIFHHGLDDPIALHQQAEMILEVAGGDQARQPRLHECGRSGLARSIQSSFGNAVPPGDRSGG
jgi:hypothetical protein